MQQFDNRKDLSLCEKMAIMSYRYIGYPQHIWKIGLKGKRSNIDCDVINGYLRGKIPESRFTKLKLKYLKYLIATIAHAINKSSVDRKTLAVYKGVSYFPELDDLSVDDKFVDMAFNSFSTSEKKALEYSKKNKTGENIIFALELKRGDKAVYMDNVEHEWLVQRGSKYHIVRIGKFEKSKIWGKAIIYYLRLI